MAFIDTVKAWFQQGDYPTESQFAETFNKLRFKDEQLAINEVAGLQNVLNALAAPVEAFAANGADILYQVPVGYLLEKIIIAPNTACTPSAKYAGGVKGNLVEPHEDVLTEDVWDVNVPAISNVKNIVVQEVTDGIVIFIKRKIIF
jgi:hypothetical protein